MPPQERNLAPATSHRRAAALVAPAPSLPKSPAVIPTRSTEGGICLNLLFELPDFKFRVSPSRQPARPLGLPSRPPCIRQTSRGSTSSWACASSSFG